MARIFLIDGMYLGGAYMLLTTKIGGGPKKNFPPQHKKGITVPNPDTTTEWTPVDPNTYLLQRDPPRQASQLNKVAENQKYSLELTARSNPAITGLPMDPATPRYSFLWTLQHPDTEFY